MNVVEQILQEKIVAIIRLDNYDTAVEVATALVEGGVPILEFTLTGKGAIEAISAVKTKLGDKCTVGVGSVLEPEDVAAAVDAGAQFIVTPALRKAVIATSLDHKTPVLSGGLSPTELLEAHESGCELVKLFPAQLGGPRYLKDVLAPMPFLKLVPTGGVSPDNAREYLAAGAVALGIGGNLISKQAVAAREFAKITAAARMVVAAIR